MKRNRIEGYGRLKRKVFFQTIALAMAALLMLGLVYIFVWAGRGANFVVTIIQYVFNQDYYDAINIYQQLFRNNAVGIMLAAFALIFLVLIRFFLTWFMRYFNEISYGIDGLLKEDGKEIQLSPELGPMEDKLNTVRNNLALRDREAKQAEQRKNDLVMYLAHDIRTPLTSVIGYLSLLDETPDIPLEQKAKYLHITLDKAIKLEKLVNEFFEITRYDLTQISLDAGDVDLYYLLVQLVDEFYPLLASKGNWAELHADESLSVRGDSAKLARVFSNILKNAVSYSSPGTEISISAHKKDGDVVISFKNTGKTLPPEKLNVIFDKFYRLDSSRSTDTGGAGLGLSIAKEIVQLHGGTIFAESENDSIIITVCLPSST